MRKLIIISVIFVSFGNTLSAQSNDQASLAQSQASKDFSVDSALSNLYKFAKENPLFIEKMMPKKFNNLSVGYDFNRGKYIPVQNASQIQNIYLFSEGKTTLEKFHLYGSFNYLRSTEDSTRWAHQSRLTANAPYSFGSIKNNHYERSVYKINASVGRAMIDDNLPISLGLDYRLGNHFSNNDPRGEVKDFQLNINPAIGYNVSKHLLIGLGYQYGYGREQIRVGYKNSTYTENTVADIYVNYLLTGYGGAIPLQVQNLLRYDNNQDRQFGKFYANYKLTAKDNLLLTLKKGQENQLFKRNLTDAVGFNEFMSYTVNRSSADLIWQQSTDKKEIHLALNYNYDQGSGYDNELAGVNYINDRETYGFKLNYTLKGQNRLLNNFILAAQHLNDVKKDGNYLVDIAYSRLVLNASWGVNTQLVNNHSVGIAVSGAYSFKTSSDFLAPIESENIFYNHVIYPDFQFNTSNNYTIGIAGDYTLPAYKGILASIKVSGNYMQHVGEYVDLQRTTVNTPGKDRFFSNISLNLYF